MKKSIGLFLMLILSYVGFAQDAQFTQFYAAPMYHNPAFTGSGYAPRVMFNYRNQWPSLTSNFETTMFTVDHFIEKYNSGIGLMLFNDKQGNHLRNTEIAALYSYELKLGESNSLRLGLSGSYAMRGFNPQGLIFGDQIGADGSVAPLSNDDWADPSRVRNSSNVDFSAGALYFNKKYYFGASISHIAKPKFGFSDAGGTSTLYRKIMVNAGYTFDFSERMGFSNNDDREFTVNVNTLFKNQGVFSQLEFGSFATYTPLTFGAGYRGIPLRKAVSGFEGRDAAFALVGFRFDRFSIGYSYDITISGLNKGGGTGGAHEFSISYQLDKLDSDKTPYYKQRRGEMACPKF
ncbi:MAG: PorP/SprF family type IX secretion system membrane protein [Leadbetterella sp.]